MPQTPVVIEQAISAGGQFDETLPPGTPTDSQAIRVFPAAATGGEFVFDFTGPDASFVTYQIDQIFADFGDATISEVAIVDSKGTPTRTVLVSPGGGPYLLETPFLLAWDQKVTLKTLGASVAMIARVTASPGRVKQE